MSIKFGKYQKVVTMRGRCRISFRWNIHLFFTHLTNIPDGLPLHKTGKILYNSSAITLIGVFDMASKKKPAKKKTMFVAIAVVVVLVIAAVAVYALTSGKGGTTPAADAMVPTDYIQIDIENYGSITAELYGNAAPVTVANFMKLVDEGFYDGLTFHRIIKGFMIQGGDPMGNGMGGSEEKIKGEFSANGFTNNIAHERGVLSMARSQAYDSASSQFFIMHQKAPHLDGQYAAFGSVITGMEIVDAICENTPVADGNGTVLAANQPVITGITRIEKPADAE